MHSHFRLDDVLIYRVEKLNKAMVSIISMRIDDIFVLGDLDGLPYSLPINHATMSFSLIQS